MSAILKTTNISSSITSGNNVTLDSSDDIAIIGSDVTARDTIDLKSKTGNIAITESIDTTNTQSSEKHASAEVNLVVQNEFVETAVAVNNAVKAAEQLKQTKDDYSNYKREVKKLEASLDALKTDPQVSQTDISNLQGLIAATKDDEAYYIAAIAAATVNLASKTVAVYQQGKAAAASTATYGFDAGISLDLKGSQTDTSATATKSNASNLTASNINLATDNTKDTSVTVSGSNINATDTLNINTHDLNVIASTDTASSNSSSKDISGSVSMTVYGAASGPQVSLGYGQNESRSNSTTYTNSTLTGNTVNLDATNDATLKGATVRADEALNVNVGNNLEVVASVQDTASSSNHGMNISGGFGMGSDSTYANNQVGVRTGNGKVESVNGGIGASNERRYDTQTVITSLTGDSVNITTGKDTKLSGAVIAATEKVNGEAREATLGYANGNDTGKLNLTTNTLTTENLTDTHYNSATGFSIGANIGLTSETKDPKPDSKNAENPSGTKLNSEHLAFNTSRDVSVGKTLATVGNGTLTVGDKENSTSTENLNRDVTKVDKELYSSSTGTKVDATIDNRLFSKTGQKQIAEDFLKTGIMVDTITQIATNSTVGIGDFKDEIEKRNTTYEAVKQRVATDKNLAEQLANTAYTDVQKENIMNAITNEVMTQLGYTPIKTKLIATTEPGRDDKQVKGFYSTETGNAYVNDIYSDNNYQLIQTGATEAQRAIDAQKGSDFQQDQAYRDDRSVYSQNFGSYVADYTDFALGQSDQGSLSTEYNPLSVPVQVTPYPSIYNNDVANSNIEFKELDKTQGDNLGIQGALIGGGIEFAMQVGPEFAKQYYRNGGDLTQVDYWGIAKNIDYVDIAAMAGVGAITPNELSALNSAKKIKESWSTYQKYGELAEKTTKNIAKKARFEKKASENRNTILKEVAKQGAIFGIKQELKNLNNGENQ